MAATDAGARLTAAQRTSQLRLRQSLVRDLLRVWPAFNPADINGSWAKLEPVLVALVQSRFPLSARIAATYLPEFRAAEGVAGRIVAAVPDVPLADLVVPNLRYVGPMNANRLNGLGVQPSKIARTTLVNIEGELTRQILNGGRRTIVDTVRADRRARGYSRVTDGSPCAFCAMLAGRGAVYNTESSGSFEAHRKCGCTAEPTYWDDAPLSPSARQFADLYRKADRAVPQLERRRKRGEVGRDRAAEVRAEFGRLHKATTTEPRRTGITTPQEGTP